MARGRSFRERSLAVTTPDDGNVRAVVERVFDEEYYRRHYEDPDTRVYDERVVARLGDFVCSYVRHLEIPVRRVLDLGCGFGFWKPVVQRHFPNAIYEGVEVSEYLCSRFGWTQGSITSFKGLPADLVICQGVLQYLDAKEAARAIKTLEHLCQGALYLEVLTKRDWEENVSQARTDGNVYLRESKWYRDRLRKTFRNGGGGVFFHRDSEAVLYDLEQID